MSAKKTLTKEDNKVELGESSNVIGEELKKLLNAETGIQSDEQIKENKKQVKKRKVEESRKIHESVLPEVVNETDTQLTTEKQKARFQELESEIGTGLGDIESGTMRIAVALTEIREEKLYRSEYSSFQVYCEERWNLSRGYCNKLVDGLRVYRNLEMKIEPKLLPESVNTVVDLSSLPGDKQVLVFRKGLKEAGKKGNGKKPTRQSLKLIADIEKEKINGRMTKESQSRNQQSRKVTVKKNLVLYNL